MAKKQLLKWRPSAILHFNNFHIWSSGCHRVPTLLLYQVSSKYHGLIFRSDGDFTIFKISAILTFRGPIVGSLKSPYGTSYWSSTETIAISCLLFEKIAFLLATDRQTDRWTVSMRKGSFTVASGVLIKERIVS